jgi:type III restriction enzyme
MPDFFKNPILNFPYTYPGQHWELEDGQPTGSVIEKRRACSYLTPIPKSKRQKKDAEQADLFTDQPKVSVDGVDYDPTSIVNQVRAQVDTWRTLPESQWGVTPTTARLLRHWRSHKFATIRPFFCQVEAVETAIWLAEVAPRLKANFDYNKYPKGVNAEANSELFRIALNRDISRPLPKPETGRIAVKVINHLGDEVMKVFSVS